MISARAEVQGSGNRNRAFFVLAVFGPRLRCRLMQAPASVHRPVPHPRRQKMSIEDDPKKLRKDDAPATPEWHRARAKDLRRNGFTKMAEEHEQIARTIERQRREQKQAK